MRAKTIDFERGKNPKQIMGIGGIDPFNQFKVDFKELWDNTISSFDSLVGKTITAEMERYWMDERSHPQQETGEYTIQVESIFNKGIEIYNEHPQNIRPMIIFKSVGDSKNKYKYTGESKISVQG